MNTPEKQLEAAIALAVTYHAGQVDKNGLPYILHLIAVMSQMESIVGKTIAVMHDLVEDTGITIERLKQLGFSDEVVLAVDHLTMREGEAYAEFIQRCAHNHFARNVKICDLRHNMQTERMNQLTDKDLKRLQKYHKAIQFLLSLDDERLWK
jgi:(p)ppGpp synthase/HD superfamily hydrolase